MAKSLFVSEETHKNLMLAKMELGFRSVDEMLKELVVEVRKARFLEASDVFRSKVREKRLSLLLSKQRARPLELSCSKSGSGKREGHSRRKRALLGTVQA